MLRNLQRAVLFLVGFTLTIQNVHLRLGFMTMTPTTLVTTVLLLLAGVHLVTSGRRGRRGRDSKAPWVALFAVSFVVSSLYGLAAGATSLAIFGEARTHLALILYYFLVVYVVRARDDLVLLLWAVVLGGVITAIPAALGIETGKEMAGGTRFEGLSGQPNVLGRDQAVCLAIAAALYFANRSTVRRIVIVAAGGVAVVGVALSLSRAAFGAAIGMWGLWMMRSRRGESIKYAAPALLLLAGVALLAPDYVVDRARSVIQPEEQHRDYSIETRTSQIVWGMRALASNPLVGVGTANFILWAREQPDGKSIAHLIHNGYMHVAASQGLLGLVPYLMLTALAWRDYTRAWRYARPRRGPRRRDRQLEELAHYAVFLQIAYFGTLIVALAHPATRAKTMWLLYALSTVVWRLARERVAELEAEQVSSVREDPRAASADLPLLGPQPAPVAPR
jgi:O-antigen ligase